jgi:hypothetical protein
MSDTPMDVSYNAIVTDPTPANPSSHINPSVGIKKPQYSLNQSRPTGSGIHNKPGVSIWAGSAFGKSITAEVIAPSTYQGCDCATCKEMNVDCPDCPMCANPISDEDAISEMKANVPLPENPIMPTNTYQKCECEMCIEQNIPCSSCPLCGGGLDAETQMAMYDSSIGKSECCSEDITKQAPCWEGYVQRGMKPGDNGKPVPNCVPAAKADDFFEDDDTVEYYTDTVAKADGYSPPAGARSAARRAIKFKEDGKANGAGTSVGWTRAGQLARGETISLSTVKRMYSYFSRHEVDKKGKDWGNSANPSNGYIMWLAWGGDAGFSWSRGIVNREKDKSLFAEFGKDYTKETRTDRLFR